MFIEIMRRKRMKKGIRKALAAVLALSMTAALASCGSTGGKTAAESAPAAETSAQAAATGAADTTAAPGEKIVNIGVTDQLGTLNPLNMDWTFINLYSTSLMFLPLASFNSQNSVDYMLAESITTDDNLTFHVKIRDDASWSDGQPVTSDDVIFTILRMTSPEVANYNFDFSMFKGFDGGASPSGAESIDGLKKIDDKNLEFIATTPMSLNTFLNNVATWICILPSHVLKDVPAKDLLTYDWFNHPDVVDGPYVLDSYDSAHYISYHANDKYMFGAPKIDKLNVKIVQPSELLAGLKSGEIDFINPSTGAIPATDRDAVEKLDGVKAVWTEPVTNEMTFFNTKKVTDARVRKAFVEAIDRNTILSSLLGGHGEITDGFVMSGSPLYGSSKGTIPYDPQDAKKLVDEAVSDGKWDSSTELQYYVSSSDDFAVKASQIIQQELAQAGIKVKINTVDFATLMSVAGTDDVDVFSVQYTITPADFYADENSLVNAEESWTGGYQNPDVAKALAATQTASSEDELKKLYRTVDDKMIEDVPMFSLYFMSNLGVVSSRLQNATPSLYGSYNNIQEWDIAE